MAGLENQMRHLKLMSSNQTMPNSSRGITNSPTSNLKVAPGRPAVPLPTSSGANTMIHFASPTMLEGRQVARPEMPTPTSGSRASGLSNSSMMSHQQRSSRESQQHQQYLHQQQQLLQSQHQQVQPQHQQQQPTKNQLIQNYLISQQQSAERSLAQQQKAQTLLRNQQNIQKQQEHSLQQQRNAIAQQLVQKSQTNREASYSQLINQQQQQQQQQHQQMSRGHPKQVPVYTNSKEAGQSQQLPTQSFQTNSNQNTPQKQPSRSQQQLQQAILAQQQQQHQKNNNQMLGGEGTAMALQAALNTLQSSSKPTRGVPVGPPRGPPTDPPAQGERTYMNVQPVAVVGRNGRVMKPGDTSVKLQEQPGEEPKKTPAIPKSQEVKHRQEPLYSTILGSNPASGVTSEHGTMFEDTAMYANYAPVSLYSNYSNYSELDVLRSSDSHCSAEEEHTEGLPHLGPDSPVSSSYSELRQAHVLAANQLQLAPGMAAADGLYEPVIPPKGGGGTSAQSGGQTKHFKSLSNSSDQSNSDYFGTCVKCGSQIVGEGSGCSAMGRVYHIQCFTCTECNCLLQGLPFYAVDGAPLCHTDYMNTLEKCCKCFNPILDRILRATGKPYHPTCFTCLVCNKSLDGIPFTVDATNQIHCIEDFHRRFAPRCSVCQHPIMPTPGQEETVRVVALDRSFHIDCYRCVDCNLLLSSEEEGRGCYPLDNHVLCKQCNTRRIQALTSRITPD